jgi:Rod binding domain-containing protein
MIALSGLGQAGAALGATANTADAQRKSKLTDAAQQFEALFLQQLLKPLQEEAKDNGEEKSPGSDTMSSYGTEAMAGAIAKGGGMGIARQIVAKVELERSQHRNGTVKAF